MLQRLILKVLEIKMICDFSCYKKRLYDRYHMQILIHTNVHIIPCVVHMYGDQPDTSALLL